MFFSSDILIIGPKVIRPSLPKVLVYSKNGDPSDIISIDEMSNSDDATVEEKMTCMILPNVSFIYECMLNKKVRLITIISSLTH